jgi:hypothetical protein
LAAVVIWGYGRTAMLDTLKLTKRLEGAGLERPVAEAMVALMLLIHLGAVWGIVAAHLP